MTHLLKKGERYYYNRRVPELVRPFDKRNVIRIALHTDSRTEAKQKAFVFNEQIEAYWNELLSNETYHDDAKFRKAVTIARRLGFGYQPISIVASLPLAELAKRTQAAIGATADQVAAVLGGLDEPELTIKQALDKFWGYTKDRILNKSDHQIRKWRNPRKRAIRNFVEVVGNKAVVHITRDDVIKFRDWWLTKIKSSNMSMETANKDFIHVKNILETVAENLQLQIDTRQLFKKIVLKDRFANKRLPLSSLEIINILESPALMNLNKEARLFLHVAAETGARPAEIIGLLPEDIHLDCEVPYISIKDRPNRPLKTAHSQRDIPIVGYALNALRELPEGFPSYLDKPDLLSSVVNKFLRENKLLPSKQHSVYSLRHSFQDRLTVANAPERVQCELMGHKFHRPKYGNGGNIKYKRKWMLKIQL